MQNNVYIIVTPFFPNEESYIGSYIYDQAKELNKHYAVRVIKLVSFFSMERDYTYQEFDVMVFKVFDLPFFVLPGVFNSINSLRFRNFIKNNNLLKYLNIIHSHVSYPSAYLANAISPISKAKTIIQHHGIDVLQTLNGRLKFVRKLQKKFISNQSIKQLNKIGMNVYVSKKVRSNIRSHKMYNPKNEYVLYNGVDRTKFYNNGQKKNNDIFFIGCVANFWHIKDQISLIQAVHKIINSGLDNIRLNFIGSGVTLVNCKQYVKSHDLEAYITFEKELPHHKLNDFYNSIDLFVLPSYYEALGCVFIEAWATDTPIISVKNQGISELIPEHELDNLLSDERCPESLKEKILAEYSKRREYKFDHRYDIKNTISEFLKLPFFND